MNCIRTRKYLPLYIDADLSLEKKKKVQIHLASCEDCQRKYENQVRALKTAKEWLEEGAVAWTDADWDRIFRNALSERPESSSGFAPRPFKKGWAFAVIGAVVILVVFLVTRPMFLGVQDFSQQTSLAKHHSQHQEGAVVKSSQDVVSMTMVSRETGLKVVWVLNKNFNLEEME